MRVNDQNIGKFVKDALEGFEVQPDPHVWQNVKKNTPFKTPFLSPLAKFIYVATIVVSLGVVWYVNLDDTTKADHSVVIEKENKQLVVNDPSKGVEHSEQPSHVQPETNQNQKETQMILSDDEPSTHSDTSTWISQQPTISMPVIDTANVQKENRVQEQQQAQSGNEAKKEKVYVEDDGASEEEHMAQPSTPFVPEFSDDVTICFGTNAQLSVEEGYDYHWNTGEFVASINVSPLVNTTYSVTVTNREGQEATHNFNVIVDENCHAVILPSAFSPDGDALNDVLYAYGQECTNFKMLILDRNYKRIFESKDITIGWDGTFNGETLPTGVYVCIIHYTDALGKDHVLKQTVTLIR